jgi:hypothetical protein
VGVEIVGLMRGGNMKIKSDGKGGWKLLGAPPGTRLRRVTVTFPSGVSHAGGKSTPYISGPAKVNIGVQHADGSLESISNVAIEW